MVLNGAPDSGIDGRPSTASDAMTKATRPRLDSGRPADSNEPVRGSRPTLVDDIFADLRQRLDALQVVATQRREPREDDEVADGMDWAIERIRAIVAEIDANHEYLSTDQYAALHGGITPQSVCNWIRKDELDATETPNGWRIKRGAQRQQKRRAL